MTDTRAVQLPVGEPWNAADLSRPHLIGVAGAGMSALARILISQAGRVSGSDRVASPRLAALAGVGATVYTGHQAEHVAGASCAIVSTAIRDDNVEVVAARRRGIPVLHRAQALAQLMTGRAGALVTGTHGKTTVSAMLAHILRHTGADPSFAIGADWTLPVTGGHLGSGPFVAEADESDRSFRWLRSGVAVVTGIEDDHPEQYPTTAALAEQITAWLRDLPCGAAVITNADDPLAMRATDAAAIRRITYGVGANANVRMLDFTADGSTSRAVVLVPDGRTVEIRLGVPGRVMAHNAMAALASALELGVDASIAASALAYYTTVRRRLTVHGNANGVTVVDSFAHHPSAIGADIDALAALADGRVLVVFQPSGYRRTVALGERMGAKLAVADHVTLLPIHDPYNGTLPGATTRAIQQAITGRDGRVASVGDGDEALGAVLAEARPGDVVVTMGTGDVTDLGPRLVTELSRSAFTAEPAGRR